VHKVGNKIEIFEYTNCSFLKCYGTWCLYWLKGSKLLRTVILWICLRTVAIPHIQTVVGVFTRADLTLGLSTTWSRTLAGSPVTKAVCKHFCPSSLSLLSVSLQTWQLQN